MAKSRNPAPSGFAEEAAPFTAATAKPRLPPYKPFKLPPRVRARIGPGGRLVIPAAFREAAGLEEGTEVNVVLDGEEVRIFTPAAGLRRARQLVREGGGFDGYTVDDFIRERPALWGETDE